VLRPTLLFHITGNEIELQQPERITLLLIKTIGKEACDRYITVLTIQYKTDVANIYLHKQAPP